MKNFIKKFIFRAPITGVTFAKKRLNSETMLSITDNSYWRHREAEVLYVVLSYKIPWEEEERHHHISFAFNSASRYKPEIDHIKNILLSLCEIKFTANFKWCVGSNGMVYGIQVASTDSLSRTLEKAWKNEVFFNTIINAE